MSQGRDTYQRDLPRLSGRRGRRRPTRASGGASWHSMAQHGTARPGTACATWRLRYTTGMRQIYWLAQHRLHSRQAMTPGSGLDERDPWMGGAASQHENELFLDVLELNEPAFAVNGSHRIVAWNDGAERLLGLRAEEVVGKRCYETLSIENNAMCQACRYFTGARPDIVDPTLATLAQRRLSISIPLSMAGTARRVQVTTLAAHTRTGQTRFVHLLRRVAEEAESEVASDPARSAPQRERPIAPAAPAAPATSLAGSRPHDACAGASLAEPAESGSKLRRPEALTHRELEVLRLLGAGYSTDDIARELSITRVTARNHVNKVLDKLGVNSRLQAVVIASQLQLI